MLLIRCVLGHLLPKLVIFLTETFQLSHIWHQRTRVLSVSRKSLDTEPLNLPSLDLVVLLLFLHFFFLSSDAIESFLFCLSYEFPLKVGLCKDKGKKEASIDTNWLSRLLMCKLKQIDRNNLVKSHDRQGLKGRPKLTAKKAK